MPSIIDVNLKRTDTTHDLSQKAKKRYLKQAVVFLYASDTTKKQQLGP